MRFQEQILEVKVRISDLLKPNTLKALQTVVLMCLSKFREDVMMISSQWYRSFIEVEYRLRSN